MSSLTNDLQSRAEALRTTVREAASGAGRAPDSVKIVAVSKTRSAEEVRAAYRGGFTRFGENFLQDALPKIRTLNDLPLEWHFIGRIQSNKTRDIAEHFDWVHTLDREKIATRLNDQRSPDQPLNVLLQVNVDGDRQKGGVAPDAQSDELISAIESLPHLCLRGCMTILSQDTDPETGFHRLYEFYERQHDQRGWDTLSMGMSQDYATAIGCGATHVRIGTAIFGPRSPKE